jgi:hypothetical protein
VGAIDAFASEPNGGLHPAAGLAIRSSLLAIANKIEYLEDLLHCMSPFVASSGGSRQCSEMPVMEGEADGRQTPPAPPP